MPKPGVWRQKDLYSNAHTLQMDLSCLILLLLFFLLKHCGYALSCAFAPTIINTQKWSTSLPILFQIHPAGDSFIYKASPQTSWDLGRHQKSCLLIAKQVGQQNPFRGCNHS